MLDESGDPVPLPAETDAGGEELKVKSGVKSSTEDIDESSWTTL
jgi:hypothetical protein